VRAERLLDIVTLLQGRGRLTVAELAVSLGVSTRTIQRDMEALSAAGYPVYAERGRAGGWALDDQFRAQVRHLNPEEVKALFASASSRYLADLGLALTADRAYLKLLEALPRSLQAAAADFRQRLYIDVAGWHRPRDAMPHIATVAEAVWQARELNITYERYDGTTTQRVVQPLGLVAKGSAWYLLALTDGETRSYRVSRIQAAAPGAAHFARPADFDLARHWQAAREAFVEQLPRYTVRLRVRSAAVDRLKVLTRYAPQVALGEAHGWTTLEMQFDVDWEACGALMGMGDAVRVEAPAALRDLMAQRAREVLEAASAPLP
jgi:predicted DNA-binding transcriptional regulator YafY